MFETVVDDPDGDVVLLASDEAARMTHDARRTSSAGALPTGDG